MGHIFEQVWSVLLLAADARNLGNIVALHFMFLLYFLQFFFLKLFQFLTFGFSVRWELYLAVFILRQKTEALFVLNVKGVAE
jgi:hypothetical protein